MQAVRRGDGNNRYCACRGNEMRGTGRIRGVTQGEGAAWVVDAWTGESRTGDVWAGDDA